MFMCVNNINKIFSWVQYVLSCTIQTFNKLFTVSHWNEIPFENYPGLFSFLDSLSISKIIILALWLKQGHRNTNSATQLSGGVLHAWDNVFSHYMFGQDKDIDMHVYCIICTFVSRYSSQFTYVSGFISLEKHSVSLDIFRVIDVSWYKSLLFWHGPETKDARLVIVNLIPVILPDITFAHCCL